MSVRLVGTIRRYTGTSRDPKPALGLHLDGLTITSQDLPIGSQYHEDDTGDDYVWDGQAWGLDARSFQAGRILTKLDEGLSGLLDEAEKQTPLLQEAVDAGTRIRGKVEVFSPLGPTPLIQIPGIGTAAAYATGDAFGVMLEIPVPIEGVIATAVFHDHDNEGIQKDLILSASPFTATADNAAFAPSDLDLTKVIGVVTFDVFTNFNANKVAVATPALYYKAPLGYLYGQFVTRGADNIAAAKLPEFFLVVS